MARLTKAPVVKKRAGGLRVTAAASLTAEDIADEQGVFAESTGVERPAVRPLKTYAFDPSEGRYVGNEMTLNVKYEDLLPGPIGRRIAVIDYDGANHVFYKPVDLDDRRILIRGGLSPTESDPRFHQQMVYAVVSETIQRFEAALGRHVHWRLDERVPDARGVLPRGILPATSTG